MTDNEIIKAWEDEITLIELDEEPSISIELITNTLDIIKRLKAELGIMLRPFELQVEVSKQIEQKIKAEAIKEFAERLKNCFCISKEYLDIMHIIDNTLIEMEKELK